MQAKSASWGRRKEVLIPPFCVAILRHICKLTRLRHIEASARWHPPTPRELASRTIPLSQCGGAQQLELTLRAEVIYGVHVRAGRDGGAGEAGKTGVKRKAGGKRPKLTLEHLKKPAGMPHVVTTLADQFRASFRGPGHEVGPETGSPARACLAAAMHMQRSQLWLLLEACRAQCDCVFAPLVLHSTSKIQAACQVAGQSTKIPGTAAEACSLSAEVMHDEGGDQGAFASA